MSLAETHLPRIPAAPNSIQKGIPLKHLLGSEAIDCLARNIRLVHPQFDAQPFCRTALDGLEPLGIMQRGQHLASVLRQFLPDQYSEATEILLASLTPPLRQTDENGLAVFFYLPHVFFVAEYGLEAKNNGGRDPFEISMRAQYELTKRFSAEFSLRPFLIQQPARTMSRLFEWTTDPDPHVRRLCSEGTRPRLPWAKRIPAFIANPSPSIPILEALKDDPSLYVRRSVANHLGDIAKDHPDVVFAICERWLSGASNEVKWLVRHALRHPAKRENRTALRLRSAAKAEK
jgi:3-methyladenine DNA glycosylase AlkC